MDDRLLATTSRHASAAQHFTTDCSFYVPPPDGGDIAVAQQVTTRLFQRASSSIELTAKRSAEAGKVFAEWRAALDKQIGADTWQRLLDYSRKQRISNFGLEDSGPRQIALDRIATAKKKAQKGSLKLLDDAKVDRNALRRIHAEAHEKLLRKLGPSDKRAQPLKVVREEDVPAAIREGRTNPWFVKKPPYDGWYWVWSGWNWGGDIVAVKHNVEIIYSLNFPGPYISGQFGHYSKYENFDAGDFDACNLNVVSEVGFWYHPPQPGQRQVWVKIRCRKARADVYLDDEYGVSNSNTHTFSRLRFNVAEVLGLEGETGDWHLHIPGDPDSTWFHVDWIAPQTVLWLPFVANFPPGWVYVGIGSDDYRYTYLNDVSTSQGMDSRYLAEEVWIET